MYSIKLSKFYDVKKDHDEIISTSIQVTKGFNRQLNKETGNKIITTVYYDSEGNVQEKKKILEIDNYDYIMNYIKELNLEKLKNNYYTDELPYSLSWYELSYDMFKIVGTYDNYIDSVKSIEQLLEFKDLNIKEE